LQTNIGQILNSLDLEIILTDGELKILWINTKAAAVFAPENFQYWYETIRDQSQDSIESCTLCQEIIASARPVSGVLHLKRDKASYYTRIFSFPVDLPDYPLLQYAIFQFDVTAGEKAHQAQLAIQTIMHEALKESGDAFFITDEAGCIRTWNRGATIIFGYAEDEIIGKNFSDLIPMHAFDNMSIEQNSSAESYPIRKFETMAYHKDGHNITIDLTRSEIRTDDQLSGASFIAKDVSRRKKLQHRLQNTIEKFYKLNALNEYLYFSQSEADIIHTTLLSITSGIGLRFDRAFLLLLTPDKKFLTGRRAMGPSIRSEVPMFKAYTGKGTFAEQLNASRNNDHNYNAFTCAKMIKSLSIELTTDNHICNYALQNRKSILISDDQIIEPTITDELKGLKTLREYFQSQRFILAPLTGKSSEIGVLIADNFLTKKEISITDMEILKSFTAQAGFALENARLQNKAQDQFNQLSQAHQKMQQQQDEIIRSQRLAAIGEMSAKIAHEIRNPLVTMGGLANAIAKMSDEDSKVQSFARKIYTSAINLEQILSDILGWVAIKPLAVEKCKIADLIRENSVSIMATYPLENIDIEVDLPANLVLGIDAPRISQVINNIIRNAVQAMQGKGKIAISCQYTEKGDCEIAFKDNGPGISKKDLKKLFEPFFTTKADGSGLGLPISKQIMQQHSGNIRIESKPGKGATIYLVFPKTLIYQS
jgi:PAS domain S-box-containing protein